MTSNQWSSKIKIRLKIGASKIWNQRYKITTNQSERKLFRINLILFLFSKTIKYLKKVSEVKKSTIRNHFPRLIPWPVYSPCTCACSCIFVPGSFSLRIFLFLSSIFLLFVLVFPHVVRRFGSFLEDWKRKIFLSKFNLVYIERFAQNSTFRNKNKESIFLYICYQTSRISVQNALRPLIWYDWKMKKKGSYIVGNDLRLK